MIFAAQNDNPGPRTLGSVRAALGLDQLGRGCTNTTEAANYYKPLIDPGDGSLLTVDDSTTVLDKYWVPRFANVSLGPDAIVDCNGHDLTVGSLTGFGTVTNAATLTVAERFVLKVSDAVSAPLKVDGTLAFASGAVVDVDSPVEPSAEQREAIREGVVVARATEIKGRPTIRPEFRAAGYRVRKQGNELVLTLAKGLLLILR